MKLFWNFKNKLLSGRRSHQFEFSGKISSVFANSESKRRLPIVLFFKRYFLVLEALQIGLNLALMLNDLFLDISKISLGSFGSNPCCIYFDVLQCIFNDFYRLFLLATQEKGIEIGRYLVSGLR